MAGKQGDQPPKRPSEAEIRQRRLAEALRANLKRRKAPRGPVKDAIKPDPTGD
jgi:hypothetical protein